MSKAKDRARAESRLNFRNGHLVSKEEWYKANPTREMVFAQRLPLDPKDTDAVAAEAEAGVKFSYFCSTCNHRHTAGSKICTEHRQYARTPITLGEA